MALTLTALQYVVVYQSLLPSLLLPAMILVVLVDDDDDKDDGDGDDDKSVGGLVSGSHREDIGSSIGGLRL